MLDKAFSGGKNYWGLVVFWFAIILAGMWAYAIQLSEGLIVTGLSRDVPWGFYISQFTFLVGVAASAVMVVLPYYLHHYKAFGRMVILGEFLAVSAVLMCMLFIFVDMGQPMRVLNVVLHPTLNSVMFWDMTVLFGYLILNLVIGWMTFDAERKGGEPPKWIKPLIYLSIPWAVSIHTVTAFLYSGLEARSFWMTAILAPRFLASAFASGPSLLIILALILRKFTTFDVGSEAIQKLAVIVTYAIAINVFFVAVELFTGLYSNIPHHLQHFEYLFLGLHGKGALVPWIWTSQTLIALALVLMLFPGIRKNEVLLAIICPAIIIGIWIEKGMGLIVTGFIPSPLESITEYAPTGIELTIALGVYAIGFLVLTVLYRIVVNVREGLNPS
ncbi:MAG: polysulfide reductase NrfD [Deltaproteobacteria bacterium]|nr:polysulfide reductase NrfD [Deltaproteobacteria bacterium]